MSRLKVKGWSTSYSLSAILLTRFSYKRNVTSVCVCCVFFFSQNWYTMQYIALPWERKKHWCKKWDKRGIEWDSGMEEGGWDSSIPHLVIEGEKWLHYPQEGDLSCYHLMSSSFPQVHPNPLPQHYTHTHTSQMQADTFLALDWICIVVLNGTYVLSFIITTIFYHSVICAWRTQCWHDITTDIQCIW